MANSFCTARRLAQGPNIAFYHFTLPGKAPARPFQGHTPKASGLKIGSASAVLSYVHCIYLIAVRMLASRWRIARGLELAAYAGCMAVSIWHIPTVCSELWLKACTASRPCGRSGLVCILAASLLRSLEVDHAAFLLLFFFFFFHFFLTIL